MNKIFIFIFCLFILGSFVTAEENIEIHLGVGLGYSALITPASYLPGWIHILNSRVVATLQVLFLDISAFKLGAEIQVSAYPLYFFLGEIPVNILGELTLDKNWTFQAYTGYFLVAISEDFPTLHGIDLGCRIIFNGIYLDVCTLMFPFPSPAEYDVLTSQGAFKCGLGFRF